MCSFLRVPLCRVIVCGLVSKLVGAFGVPDVTETLSIAGTLASLDEYWSSELCFKMVSRVQKHAVPGIPYPRTVLH